MHDLKTKRKNGILVLISGIVLLGIAIYLLITEFQNENSSWYAWLGLLFIADLLIIAGIRQLKKYPKDGTKE